MDSLGSSDSVSSVTGSPGANAIATAKKLYQASRGGTDATSSLREAEDSNSDGDSDCSQNGNGGYFAIWNNTLNETPVKQRRKSGSYKLVYGVPEPRTRERDSLASENELDLSHLHTPEAQPRVQPRLQIDGNLGNPPSSMFRPMNNDHDGM